MTTAVTPTPGFRERLAGSVLRTVGQASDCVRLGYVRGFDSGEMMDAIYRDQPSGRWGIGGIVDRIYLDQPGCRGLRGRKTLLIVTLAGVIAEQRAAGVARASWTSPRAPRPTSWSCSDRGPRPDLRRSPATAIRMASNADGRSPARRRGRPPPLRDRRRPRRGVVLGIDPGPRSRSRPGSTSCCSTTRRSPAPWRCSVGCWCRAASSLFTTQVAHPQVAMMAAVPAHDGPTLDYPQPAIETAERLATEAGFTRVSSRMEPEGIFAVSTTR